MFRICDQNIKALKIRNLWSISRLIRDPLLLQICESVQFFDEIRESMAFLGQIRRSASLFTPPPPSDMCSLKSTGKGACFYISLWREFHNFAAGGLILASFQNNVGLVIM